MFGLLNENTKQFEGFVPADELWMHILPGYNPVEMSQAQASAIVSSLNLEEPKSPEIISAKLVDGKIFTGDRLFETPIHIRISKPNYEHFANLQTEVPEYYYVIDCEEEKESDLPVITYELLSLLKRDDLHNINTIAEMKFILRVIGWKLSSSDIKHWCKTFGPETVIGEIKSKHEFAYNGIMLYAIEKSDIELIDWLSSKEHAININYIPQNNLPPEFLIVRLLKFCNKDSLIYSMINQESIKYISWVCENTNLIKFKHLKHACKHGLNDVLIAIYRYFEITNQLCTDILMDIAADKADIELMQFLHGMEYTYNVAEIFPKYEKIFRRNEKESTQELRLKYHPVVEVFVRQWSIKKPFDKINGIEVVSGYKQGHRDNFMVLKIFYNNSKIEDILKNENDWWKRPEDYSNEELKDLILKSKKYTNCKWAGNTYFEELIRRGVYDKSLMNSCLSFDNVIAWKCILHNGFNPYKC